MGTRDALADGVRRVLLGIAATRPGARTYRLVVPVLDRAVLRLTGHRHTLAALVLPTLVLASTGAKTGRPRQQPLCFLRDRGDLVVTGTNWGQGQHPAWTANLLAHPAARVQLGGETRDVTAVLVEDPGEWERLYARFEAMSPNFRSYRAWAGTRRPRLFRLVTPG